MSWTQPDFTTGWLQKASAAPPPTSISVGVQPEPEFYNNSTARVFAPRGGTASIECQVKNLGDRAVSRK